MAWYPFSYALTDPALLAFSMAETKSVFVDNSPKHSSAKNIANLGLEGLKKDNSLLKGVNVFKGKVTHAAVANSFNVKYHSPREVL